MSYDYNIWATEFDEACHDLLVNSGFLKDDNNFILQSKNWQIFINYIDGLDAEDVPIEASSLFPGLACLIEINLEPSGAPNSAFRKLSQIVKKIAKVASGVIEDKQEDSFKLPSGVKSFHTPRREKDERFSQLMFSWWFCNDVIKSDGFWSDLFDLYERYLPEGIPQRYGSYEPPQYKYAEHGRVHCLQFLKENMYDRPICYHKRPVLDSWYGFSEETGFIDKWGDFCGDFDFYSNFFEISVDASVLNQKGWQNRLQAFWYKMSDFLDPIYGDVRTLHGLISARGTYYTDLETEHHPVRSLFWNGIPKKLGHAVVVGDAYFKLWPLMQEKAEKRGDLFFFQKEDWRTSDDLTEILGEVPNDIAQVQPDGCCYWEEGYEKKAPKVFPFSKGSMKG